MSVGLKASDADFAVYAVRSLPYIEDTEGVFIFGTDATKSAKNRSPNALVNGTFVGGGSGQFFRDYAELNINYSLDSGISYNGLNKSVVSVSAFMKTEHSSVVAPQLQCSHIAGAGRIQVQSAGFLFGAGNLLSLGVPTLMAVTSAGGAGNDTAYISSSGIFRSATAADNSVTAGNIIFGPRGGRDSIGDLTYHKHYLALVYDRELSGAEMLEVHAWAAEYLSARGVMLT